MRAFYTTYGMRYIIRQELDAVGEVGKLNNFEAFLHDMIAIDVLDEVDAVWLDEPDEISLHLRTVLGKFDGFLDHPAPITVLGELKNMFLDDFKESLLVGILSIFKELLEDIVSKLILG